MTGAPAGWPTYLPRSKPVYAKRINSPADLPPTAPTGFYDRDAFDAHWQVHTAHGPVEARFGDYLATDGNGNWWPECCTTFKHRYQQAPATHCTQCGERLPHKYQADYLACWEDEQLRVLPAWWP